MIHRSKLPYSLSAAIFKGLNAWGNRKTIKAENPKRGMAISDVAFYYNTVCNSLQRLQCYTSAANIFVSGYLSCSPLPPSILCSSALTALDSRRWNRNFDITHLQKKEGWPLISTPFDVMTWNLHHGSPGSGRKRRGLMLGEGSAKVKGLLGRNKPSNPTRGPRTAFDVQYTEVELKIEPWEQSDDSESIH